MKKFATLLLTLLMTVSLTACAGDSKSEEITPALENAAEDAGTPNSSTDNTYPAGSGPAETSGNENEGTDNTEKSTNDNAMNQVKILVAYFSATNTTKGVAENIAEGLGADLYEIVPEEPYTDADLNYNDDNSRSTIEMNDPDARPAISGNVSNMEQYDIVFIGYPIWWGDAPRIVSTFVESYDFDHKTIVPFCTSGSSGVGSSDSNLAALTDGAQWLPGKRFSGSSSQQEAMEWVNGLGLNIE